MSDGLAICASQGVYQIRTFWDELGKARYTMLIFFSLLSVPFTIFDIAEVYFMFACLCVFAGELGRKCEGKGCVKH